LPVEQKTFLKLLQLHTTWEIVPKSLNNI